MHKCTTFNLFSLQYSSKTPTPLIDSNNTAHSNSSNLTTLTELHDIEILINNILQTRQTRLTSY